MNKQRGLGVSVAGACVSLLFSRATASDPVTYRISIRGYRAGFLFVVALLIGVSVFTLWADLRTNERVDALVTQAFIRDALIGRIRVAALTLESAVDAHIRATTDEERSAADEEMENTLDDISLATQDYTKDLPPGETEIWTKFRDTSHALAAQVRKAVNYSNRKEAERARKHLVQEIKPITLMMDHLANQLSDKNAEETRQLLRHLEDLRFRTTVAGAVVAAIAVLLSLLVGYQVMQLLTKQATT
ncbi:MAG: MCP four helix bundle domain-containing protein, partial [Myxococcaceae bacterium]